MKIAVVNYSEFNPCPPQAQVVDDICRLYLCASKDTKEDMGTVLNNQLIQLSSYRNLDSKYDLFYVDTSSIEKRNQLIASIRSYNPDLLVSYNLAGFELSTLADSLSYNLIDCRQFHIINKRNLPNEMYMNIFRSLNLFLFKDYKDRL